MDAEYSSVHDVEVDNTQRRKNMIQLDGYYVCKRGVVVEKYEDTFMEHPMSDDYAKRIVETNNDNILAYSEEYMEQVRGEEYLDFGDWIKFNTGLMPYIKQSTKTVQMLRLDGYDYKVNMQSGMIVG